jgi:Uma2 family endonuclease
MKSKPRLYTPEDYFIIERQSQRKYEYVDGELFAMSGASRRHNLLATNLIRHAATAALERLPCKVFGSDMKVRVEARNSFFYPDVSVSCDPTDCHERYLSRPCLIIEVLSPSTASADRREKRLAYATLPSLCEYVIVDQDRMRIDVYPRSGSPWASLTLDDPLDLLNISCLGLQVSLQEIYHGIEFPAPGVSEDIPEYGHPLYGELASTRS